jgi:hypothetical protein
MVMITKGEELPEELVPEEPWLAVVLEEPVPAAFLLLLHPLAINAAAAITATVICVAFRTPSIGRLTPILFAEG